MKYLIINSETGEIVSELSETRWKQVHDFLKYPIIETKEGL